MGLRISKFLHHLIIIKQYCLKLFLYSVTVIPHSIKHEELRLLQYQLSEKCMKRCSIEERIKTLEFFCDFCSPQTFLEFNYSLEIIEATKNLMVG